MADIRLAKPAAGTTQTVPSAPDGRFIFDFPADAATLTRSGDNLVLTFEDGASIQLQDFYTTYSKEEMPSFQVEGVEISGQDFFAALGEDLMPAAGPAAGSSASRSGRYNEYGGSDLLDGLDHLGRLDIGFDGGVQLATDTVEPSAYYEDDHGVTVTPSAPGTDPDDPDIPVQGEDFPPTMPHDVLQVDESALDGGSGGGSATAAGSMSVSAPDGVATITIGGVVVWQNGALTGNPVQTDEGHLDVTGFDGTNLTYTYTLDKATQEHGKEGGGENDAIAHEMEVVVTDSDGDSGSAVIRVEITDDVPSAAGLTLTPIADTAESISGQVEGLVFGADSDGSTVTVTVTVNGEEHSYTGSVSGTGEGIAIDFGPDSPVTLDKDGHLTYQRGDEVGDKQDDTYKFTVQVTDKDGDVSQPVEATLGTTTPSLPDEDPSQFGIQVDEITVKEEALVTGSNAVSTEESASGEFTVDLKGQDGQITFGGVIITVKDGAVEVPDTSFTTDLGSTVSGIQASIADGKVTVSYEYTLNNRQEHTEGDGKNTATEHITVTVSNEYGDSQSGDVVVTIVDDVPVLNSITVEGTPYGEGNSGVYIKDPNHITGTLDGLNTGADAEGSTMRVHIENDYFIGTYENGKWEFTPARNDFTPDLNEGGSFELVDDQFIYIPSVTVMPGKDFSYTMQVTVTDSDGDSTLEVKSATMRPENNPPIAEDDSFYIDKDSHFVSEITVQTNGTLISVKGEASFNGNVASVTGADHTLEYGYSQKDINGSAIETTEILTETSDDFFGRFFKDSNGNPLTMDDMVENGMLQTVVITSSMSEEDIVQAITAAQTEAETEGKVLYLTGENGEKVDISLSGHTFGTSDNPLTVIINGTMSSSNQITVNGFLYVDGDVNINARLTVNGGLAVSGNMTQSGNVSGTYLDGGEISTEIIGSVNSFEIRFDDILKNDSDPDNESISIVENSITLPKDLEDYYSIFVDYGNGIVTVTPREGSDGIADYEHPLKLEYTIQDEHGATDSAVITVSAVGHVTGSSHADTIIGSSASEVITADVSGTGGLNVPGQNYNVCVVMDSSGSIGNNGGIGAVTAAITGLAQELSVFDGEVNFAIVDFDSGSRLIEFSGPLSQLILTDGNGAPALDAEGKVQFNHEFNKALNSITEGGGTNYEAGLNSAKAWFGSQAEAGKGAEDGYTNYTFFVTDGKPTASWADSVQGRVTSSVTVPDDYQLNQEWTAEDGNTYRITKIDGIIFSSYQLEQKDDNGNWYEVKSQWNEFEGGQTVTWNEQRNIDIPQGEGPGYEWTVDGVTYRLAEGGSTNYSSNRLIVQQYHNGNWINAGTVSWNPGGHPVSTPSDQGSYEDEEDRTEGKGAADSLKEVSEIFAIGIGSNTGSLKDYATDADHVIQIDNTNNLLDAFMSGMQTITNAIPSSDVVLGGKGNDILFGDSGVGNLAALIAGRLGVDVAALTSVQVLEYINSHPEEFDVSYSEKEIDGETVAFDKADTLLGGSGDDIVYGQGGDDLLFGDGSDTATSGTSIETLNALDTLLTDAGAEEGDSYAERIQGLGTQGSQEEPSKLDSFIDSLEGTGSIEKDTDGNDILFGGTGDDVLLGMGGDDYIDGGAGEDAIFGGSGNDIIVYDSNDYLVSGGSGIDFMVSDDNNLTLSSLLNNSVDDKPLVSGIEVLLKGDAALSLTSLDQLAKDYGITLGTNAEGKETLILDMDKWTEKEDGIYAFNDGAEAGGLTLETNLTPVEASDPASEAVQQQVFTLEHGNS